MIAKSPVHHAQANFLYPDLLEQLNPKDILLQLSNKIPWQILEGEFTKFYSEFGRPAKPIRLMIGLLLLKQLENLSDERIVQEWVRNPYYQAFCGETEFQWKLPCEPSDLVHFRKRIGEDGVKKLFKLSIDINGSDSKEQEIVIDTTVQEKNVTFPTDTKLRIKVIFRCLKIAKLHNIKMRRTYKVELKKLLRTVRFKSSTEKEKVNRAIMRIQTIANILLREIERKLPNNIMNSLKEEFEIWKKAVNQKRNDKNKIYSLHEPKTVCIAKGKDHKAYEFGAKAALAVTKTTGVIVGAVNFEKNEFDGNTLPDVLTQVSSMTGATPKSAYCDRGFRGNDIVNGTEIIIPDTPNSRTTIQERRKARKNFGRRSAIEPVIGHLKSDFGLARNYLKGCLGDTINLFLAACAYNLRRWLRRAAARCLNFIFAIILMAQIATEWAKICPGRSTTLDFEQPGLDFGRMHVDENIF